MLERLKSVLLGAPNRAKLSQVSLIGVDALHNIEPQHFIIRGLRNVVIVDRRYFIEHHEEIARELRLTYPDA